jgi:hypothetical protein
MGGSGQLFWRCDVTGETRFAAADGCLPPPPAAAAAAKAKAPPRPWAEAELAALAEAVAEGGVDQTQEGKGKVKVDWKAVVLAVGAVGAAGGGGARTAPECMRQWKLVEKEKEQAKA